MSEPAKKPGHVPESYTPKKPEIVGMVEQAQANAEQITAPQTQGGTSMNPTNYDFCFSPFRSLDFTNCFASLFMFLEGFEGEADVRKEQQSRLFFLFDTVSGRSAAARGWGNQATDIYREIYDSDDMVDFLMGYTGYSYVKHAEGFAEHIRTSLAKGLPVLARLKKAGEYMDDTGDSFRLITGFSGEKLQMPEPKGAQKPPKKAPKLSEIDSIYVITGKTQRKYTLLDGLRRIKRVMDADRDAGVWDNYIKAFECSWDWLNDISLKEIKALFERAHKGTTWNCHNFAAPFRSHEYLDTTPEHYQHWIWDELKDPRFGQPRPAPARPEDDPLRLPAKQLIDWACDQSHNRQWQIHALYETRDWSKKYYHQMEWAGCETAVLLLQKLKEYDGYIYSAICGMIGILEGESG